MLHFTIAPRVFFAFTLLLFLPAARAIAQDDLNVISGKNQWLHYTDAANALYHHLADEAYMHLEKRRSTLAAYRSVNEWRERQQWIKRALLESVGPFPEKTALNARVLRTLEKDHYRVEHIIFESQPEFFVTASLFIPKALKKKGKAPAVIYCSGHSNDGYRSKVYQHVILNLVKKGFIVLAFDPVGQGERLEYFDAQKEGSSVGSPTSEHSYPGTQAFITGSSQARHMTWDGIRAVDYLLTRREVDPARIGITGRSGGGTQAAYIAAFDERIKAAAPENYITNFTRLLQSIGPQDAEQNFFHGISEGIDHGDLLLVRAPLPALMITTTRDMFSIQGARETTKEVSRIYQAYGEDDNFEMVEDDAPHASTKKNREALYTFFQRHLNNPGKPEDEEVSILGEAEIRVTPSGQVSTTLGGETVFSLNQREAQKKVDAIRQSRKNLPEHHEAVVKAAKNLSGFREPDGEVEPVFTGRIQRDGYAVEKYFLKGEGDYVVPYLLMVPSQTNQKAIVYLHPSGKGAEAAAGGEMEWFVKNGFTVLAPDLPGVGELGAGDFEGDAFIGGVSHNIWYTSTLIGRSVAGVQAGDIARLVGVLKKRNMAGAVYGVARAEMTPVLLHAAAFLPSIERLALIDHLSSYFSLVSNRFYYSAYVNGAVPGALRAYDLPDLAATLAPRKLLIAGVTDGRKEPANAPDDLAVIKAGYAHKHAEDALILLSSSPANPPEIFSQWIK